MKLHRIDGSAQAFTLIELLVVVGLIGLITALLLPAVHSARESARRTQCQNNLKQIGLGLSNYVGIEGYFPAGLQQSIDPRYLMYPSIPCSGPLDRGFTIPILPYLEQNTIYDTFNFRLAIIGPEQRTARSALVSNYVCPSDYESMRPHEFDMKMLLLDRDSDAGIDTKAMIYPSSYAGCHSSHGGLALGVISRGCEREPISVVLSNGCITGGVAVTISSITDGLSNTMTIAEKSLTTRLKNQPEVVNYAWIIGSRP